MRIALIGYGKMGKMIEKIAIGRSHEICLRINIENTADFTKENMANADVAIEFTGPESAEMNVLACLNWDIPVISGSTGWNQGLGHAKQICIEKKGSFLHASNFSIGVNIFFELNKLLAKLMADQKAYSISLKEIHHTQKKDAPSGTAVTLAEQILSVNPLKKNWVNHPASSEHELTIISERIDPAPGTHFIKYASAIDEIEIVHTAHSREGFAMGAVLAAEFIYGKTGVFSMQDVLKIKQD